ncbi:4-(cytidine 5'-diphospho)-2-C-methyl-D-erythritol kinase [Mariprofundus sp. KV]|uniref:4-(cytidine 5'-diphospho)-2-C-methyl-D-erythritol kinase n=1 Tax=Mariprofundus sp. KV TaxID=2608715 RepID=UPI0015A44CC1|nr:4-(cytidine 5'-diphospho)-2-C-methyl-D-erythritol kinase [Mariprofundus sp. KV]NWF36297.1 4-(cytidine 5'-diphospho)-2-C-methyl-D-erythritol kinase [Mariprofundus sp. KV]
MKLRLPAPAKINLHLLVTAIREDGMHELDTSFAYTDICDELQIEPCDTLTVSCSTPELSGEKNLVYKLLDAFRKQYGISQGLAVHIVKNIPAQAGLGGGSSDAATALLAANRLWQLDIPTAELITFAAPFGADIPCFLYGKASCARGIGEKLNDYPDSLPEKALLLVWPGTGLSTAEVFQHFDHQINSGDRTLTPPEGLDTIRRDSSCLGKNDLEGSACSLSLEVSQLLQALRKHSDTVWMSGSGSTCIALFDHPEQARAVAAHLKMQNPANWTFVGTMQQQHQLDEKYWDVAKR